MSSKKSAAWDRKGDGRQVTQDGEGEKGGEERKGSGRGARVRGRMEARARANRAGKLIKHKKVNPEIELADTSQRQREGNGKSTEERLIRHEEEEGERCDTFHSVPASSALSVLAPAAGQVDVHTHMHTQRHTRTRVRSLPSFVSFLCIQDMVEFS